MYKINAFITADILAFYKAQEYSGFRKGLKDSELCEKLIDLLTADNFTSGSFGFTFLNGLVEDGIVDSTFLINIYNHISNELRAQLDRYFKNYTEGQFNSTSYDDSKLLDVLKLLPKNY